MLIGLALGAIVALIATSALRFFRMEDTVEQAQFAKRERRQVVFEGVLTPRAARETLSETLLQSYAGDQVKITVERVNTPPAPR